MDVQGINTYYDYVAVFAIYVSALLFMYSFKGLLSLFKYSKEACRIITGTGTLDELSAFASTLEKVPAG